MGTHDLPDMYAHVTTIKYTLEWKTQLTAPYGKKLRDTAQQWSNMNPSWKDLYTLIEQLVIEKSHIF